eukprot:7859286-Pyramimonas_sp.AAC.1
MQTAALSNVERHASRVESARAYAAMAMPTKSNDDVAFSARSSLSSAAASTRQPDAAIARTAMALNAREHSGPRHRQA